MCAQGSTCGPVKSVRARALCCSSSSSRRRDEVCGLHLIYNVFRGTGQRERPRLTQALTMCPPKRKPYPVFRSRRGYPSCAITTATPETDAPSRVAVAVCCGGHKNVGHRTIIHQQQYINNAVQSILHPSAPQAGRISHQPATVALCKPQARLCFAVAPFLLPSPPPSLSP